MVCPSPARGWQHSSAIGDCLPIAPASGGRQRAVAFGSVADRYNRARPSYPTALIDDLMAQRPRSVLDVGCGTGTAGRLLAARECEVLGVEPDERMAAVAQSHGLAVEVTPFEMWDPKGRTL
jgi:SAM-dependent methyltransferase